MNRLHPLFAVSFSSFSFKAIMFLFCFLVVPCRVCFCYSNSVRMFTVSHTKLSRIDSKLVKYFDTSLGSNVKIGYTERHKCAAVVLRHPQKHLEVRAPKTFHLGPHFGFEFCHLGISPKKVILTQLGINGF